LTPAVVVPSNRIIVLASAPSGAEAWLALPVAKGHGEAGFGPRISRGGAARCRVPGHTFVTPQTGDMKPCGHDQRELTHLTRPHLVVVGHADTASCPLAVARSHAAAVRQRISPSRSP
jgi:hypothetical protein